ncbi:unnamed protein product [Trifolium pratense]|uniref:Uncharacterized protein n=1 Tax=Trifolium pratense TaxID=57577 RepID=A0ACB0KK85_TRIPR|nr:unnamed protein product [Trifolium pratense]
MKGPYGAKECNRNNSKIRGSSMVGLSENGRESALSLLPNRLKLDDVFGAPK